MVQNKDQYLDKFQTVYLTGDWSPGPKRPTLSYNKPIVLQELQETERSFLFVFSCDCDRNFFCYGNNV